MLLHYDQELHQEFSDHSGRNSLWWDPQEEGGRNPDDGREQRNKFKLLHISALSSNYYSICVSIWWNERSKPWIKPHETERVGCLSGINSSLIPLTELQCSSIQPYDNFRPIRYKCKCYVGGTETPMKGDDWHVPHLSFSFYSSLPETWCNEGNSSSHLVNLRMETTCCGYSRYRWSRKSWKCHGASIWTTDRHLLSDFS